MLHLLVDGPAGDQPASKEIGVSKTGKEALGRTPSDPDPDPS
jgi:hypothetical protein